MAQIEKWLPTQVSVTKLTYSQQGHQGTWIAWGQMLTLRDANCPSKMPYGAEPPEEEQWAEPNLWPLVGERL